MDSVRVIEIKENIFKENIDNASELRDEFRR